jgi:hypothetical protein
MFGTAAIRTLAFPWHWTWEKAERDIARPAQMEASAEEAVTPAKPSRREEPWRAPEWWESHHYERR